MQNYRCLAIGINRYQFLQPLSCAVADAQTLTEFLRTEVALDASQILLLTDTSPKVAGKSTYPSRETLLTWLNSSTVPTHCLWFFFRGYGVYYQGEDYLMAIDSNPHDIPNTGISLRSLFKSLQQQGADSTLAILDFHPLLISETVGKNIIALGKEMGIAVVLLAQATSGQGMLTMALLEALRYYRHSLTLAQLDAYLRDRLGRVDDFPLSTDTPVMISPSLAVGYQPFFLDAETKDSSRKTTTRNGAEKILSMPTITYPPEGIATLTPPSSPDLKEGVGCRVWGVGEEKEGLGKKTPVSPASSSLLPKLVAILGLLFLILLSQRFSESKQENKIQKTQLPNSHQALLNQAKSYLKNNQASGFNQAIQKARKIQADTSLYSEAQKEIDRWSQVIFDIAQGRAKGADFQGAIAAAKLIPADQKYISDLAKNSIKQWQFLAKQKQKNQVLIEAAQALIKENQASAYNRAITLLRNVNRNEIGYEKAQQLTKQWSQQIYQIAQLRAAQGEFQQAIAAASLIPPDAEIYQSAKQAIFRWKSQKFS